jgi:hypothetical protein
MESLSVTRDVTGDQDCPAGVDLPVRTREGEVAVDSRNDCPTRSEVRRKRALRRIEQDESARARTHGAYALFGQQEAVCVRLRGHQ